MAYLPKHTELIAERDAAGLSNKDFAAVMGCTPSVVSKKLNGFLELNKSDERIIRRMIKNVKRRSGKNE
jgi:transcriptional regulator with XRE-family HTH domain